MSSLTFLWQVFHHYMGAPLALYWINSKGELHKAILGKDLEKGQRLQVVMPAEVSFIQIDILKVSIFVSCRCGLPRGSRRGRRVTSASPE